MGNGILRSYGVDPQLPAQAQTDAREGIKSLQHRIAHPLAHLPIMCQFQTNNTALPDSFPAARRTPQMNIAMRNMDAKNVVANAKPFWASPAPRAVKRKIGITHKLPDNQRWD